MTLESLTEELRFGKHGESERRYVGELLDDVQDAAGDAEDAIAQSLSALDALIEAARQAKRQIGTLKRSY